MDMKKKKRKIDFIIHEDENEKIIFRFYPRMSSCHSFGDEPPKNHNDIYKVYYYYKVLKFYKEDDGSINRDYIELFDSGCDECSDIDEVANVCLLLTDGVEVYKREDGKEIQLLNRRMLPIGMGVEWTISKHVCTSFNWDEEESDTTYYTFMLFDWWGKGFKFSLKKKDIKSFGEYLFECCEYMLAHGESI